MTQNWIPVECMAEAITVLPWDEEWGMKVTSRLLGKSNQVWMREVTHLFFCINNTMDLPYFPWSSGKSPTDFERGETEMCCSFLPGEACDRMERHQSSLAPSFSQMEPKIIWEKRSRWFWLAFQKSSNKFVSKRREKREKKTTAKKKTHHLKQGWNFSWIKTEK